MSGPIINCPRCGTGFEGRRTSETAILDDRHTVRSVTRLRRAKCTEHGWFDVEDRGNHVTMWDWKFNRMFQRRVLRDVLKRLSTEERRMFWNMRDGWRAPDWAWLASLGAKPDWIEVSAPCGDAHNRTRDQHN